MSGWLPPDSATHLSVCCRLPAAFPPLPAGIYSTDDAFKSIAGNGATVQKLNAAPLAGCIAAQHKAAAVDPVPTCQQTWVNGTAGTGKRTGGYRGAGRGAEL